MSGAPISFDTRRSESDAPTRGPSIEEISLEQALVDTQIANERIVAVTMLIEAKSAELVALRSELAQVQQELVVIEATV